MGENSALLADQLNVQRRGTVGFDAALYLKGKITDCAAIHRFSNLKRDVSIHLKSACPWNLRKGNIVGIHSYCPVELIVCGNAQMRVGGHRKYIKIELGRKGLSRQGTAVYRYDLPGNDIVRRGVEVDLYINCISAVNFIFNLERRGNRCCGWGSLGLGRYGCRGGVGGTNQQ